MTKITELTTKVTNGGTSERGRLSADEYNTLLTTVQSHEESIASLEVSTIKNCGYFLTAEALQQAYPKAGAGSKAYVGANHPYAIYLWDDSALAWVDSGATGGEENVKLEDYYTKTETDEKLTRLESFCGAIQKNEIAQHLFTTPYVAQTISQTFSIGQKLSFVFRSANNSCQLTIKLLHGDNEVATLTNTLSADKITTVEYNVDKDVDAIRLYSDANGSLIIYEYIESEVSIIEQFTEVFSKLDELGEGISDVTIRNNKELFLSPYSASLYNIKPLVKGDIVYVSFISSQESCQLTMKLLYNNTEVATLINSLSVSKRTTIKVKLIEDANYLRVFSSANGSILIDKVQTTEQITSIREPIKDINGVAGEAMLRNNMQYVGTTPFMKMVYLDNNYKFFSVANIQRIIDAMYEADLHFLELGFDGSGGGLSFKLNDMSFIFRGENFVIPIETDFGKYLTEEDMRTIIAYARSNDIEIVASLNSPGHMFSLLKSFPQYKYKDSDNALDLDSEEACEWALALMEKYVSWFAAEGCKYINMGCDEFYNIENGYVNLFSNKQFRYAQYINDLVNMAARYRFVVLSWNDALCVKDSAYPFINRGIVVSYWKKRDNWASPSFLSAQGYKLINSSEDLYWVANGYQAADSMFENFQPTEFNGGDIVAEPIGAKFCVWIGRREEPALNDEGAAITNAILPKIALFGQRLKTLGL